jgi:hypothetical protein
MMHFTVETYTPAEAACRKCCCEELTLQPGTTTKVSVGYAPWAIPIGQLHCQPQFALEKLDTCVLPVVNNNLPPQFVAGVDMVKFDTGVNVTLNGDLKTKIGDLEGDPLTFKMLPLYGPKHGTLLLNTDGTFVYMPQSNYKGQERFYCTVTDSINTPVTFEVMIAVGIDSGTMVPTPSISVGAPVVDQRYYTVSFPVTMAPSAQPCDVWRLTVLQAALDCDCQCFTRTDCFDIKVAKC